MNLTRKEALTGIAGILAAGTAPAAVVRSMLGARGVAFAETGKGEDMKTITAVSAINYANEALNAFNSSDLSPNKVYFLKQCPKGKVAYQGVMFIVKADSTLNSELVRVSAYMNGLNIANVVGGYSFKINIGDEFYELDNAIVS